MTVILFVALIVVSGALLAPGLLIGPSLDAAVFGHVAGRLLDGVAPYVGAWDHKPPGIYLASAMVHAALGWLEPWTADWLLSLAATAGLGMAVATALGRLGLGGWPRTLAAMGATVLASHYLLALGGGLTEAPAASLVGLALVVGLGPPTRFRAAAMGMLVSLSLLLSVQLLPGGILMLALAAFLRPGGARLLGTAWIALGFAVPLAMVVAWLAAIGALPAALDAIVTYSTAYRASGGDYGAVLGAPVAAWTVLTSLFMVAPALLGAASLPSISGPTRAVVIALLLWIAATLVLFVVEGRFYAHYAIALAVPLGILAGLGLQRLGASLTRARNSSSRAVIALPLVASLVVSIVAGVVAAAMQMAPLVDQSVRLAAVSERLRHAQSGSLLVWGNEPRLYELTARPPATRYAYLYPLTTPGYSTAGMVDDVVRELTAHPPAVVVDAGSSAPGEPGFLPLLIDRPVTTDGRDLDLLDPIRAFVTAHYLLVDTVGGWPIYLFQEGRDAAVTRTAVLGAGALGLTVARLGGAGDRR